MMKDHLRSALHAIRKHRYHSILNVLGFSFALAVVILIGLYAQRELSMNMFHRDSDRIYKISGWGCPYALAGVIADGVPEIEAITNITGGRYAVPVKLEGGKEVLAHDGFLSVNNSFFDVFSFPVIAGNRQMPLPDAGSAVLTRTLAHTLFGSDDPIGKTILMYGQTPYVVTAITEDVPLNSSIRYSVILPLNPQQPWGVGKTLAQDWNSWKYEIFAKIRPGQNIDSLNTKIQRVVKANGNLQYEIERVVCYPLSDVYFNYADLFTSFKGGNHGQVMAMIWIGIIILLLAVVNFFNLSTASGMMRSKEIGLRKVNGATRGSLIFQFLAESVGITAIAMLLALLLVNVAIPFFSSFVGARYDFILMTYAWQWVLLVGGSLIVGTIAGSYPAFYLSATDPINALYTGRVRAGFGVLFFRKALIVFQLIASIGIIVCTLVISAQLNHLRTKDLGFDKEQILCIGMDETIYKQKQAFLSEVSALPFVQGISITPYVIGNVDQGTKMIADYQGEKKEIWCKVITIDTAFFSTFGIGMTQGHAPRSNEIGRFVLNESAMHALGVDDHEQLGVAIGADDPNTPTTPVVGVCKDFNFKPLKQGVEPLAVYLADIPAGLLNLRVDVQSIDDIEKVQNDLKAIYSKFNPKNPLEVELLDSYLAQLYSSEQRFKTIFTIFSVFAVLISCFGLFGLIIFSNARRKKEIGVRKVQGATTVQVVLLLIRSYLTYVGIAFVVAVPVSAYFMYHWLQGYPYRAEMNWWIFLLAGLISLSVVVLTVGFQSWRAATVNPVKSLKSE